ncbi:MAG: hypothetical protein V3T65_05915, partial [Acidobacteriota bacterium]
ILFYADIPYRDGILNNQTEPAHFIAGGVALGLILAGLVLILARHRIKRMMAAAALAAMALIYVGGAVAVVAIGSDDDDDPSAAATRLYRY